MKIWGTNCALLRLHCELQHLCHKLVSTNSCIALPSHSFSSPYCDSEPYGRSLWVTLFRLTANPVRLFTWIPSLCWSHSFSLVTQVHCPCLKSMHHHCFNLNSAQSIHPFSTWTTSGFDKISVNGLSPLGCYIVFVLLWKHVKNPILKWKCNKFCDCSHLL